MADMAKKTIKKAKKRETENIAIGQRIRFVRQSKNMTMEQLAEAADTSTQFLSQLEKGEQAMTMVKFGRLAKALGVSSDYLLFGRDKAGEKAAYAAEILGGLAPVEKDMVSQTLINMRSILDQLAPEHE